AGGTATACLSLRFNPLGGRRAGMLTALRLTIRGSRRQQAWAGSTPTHAATTAPQAASAFSHDHLAWSVPWSCENVRRGHHGAFPLCLMPEFTWRHASRHSTPTSFLRAQGVKTQVKSIYCFERKDAQETTPSRIGDALGKMVVLEQVGRLQVLEIDRIVLTHELKCRFVLEVLALALHLLMCFGEQFHRLAPPIAPLRPS